MVGFATVHPFPFISKWSLTWSWPQWQPIRFVLTVKNIALCRWSLFIGMQPDWSSTTDSGPFNCETLLLFSWQQPEFFWRAYCQTNWHPPSALLQSMVEELQWVRPRRNNWKLHLTLFSQLSIFLNFFQLTYTARELHDILPKRSL